MGSEKPIGDPLFSLSEHQDLTSVNHLCSVSYERLKDK